MIEVEVDETGVVKVISPQLSACFSTHILIDGYDIPKGPVTASLRSVINLGTYWSDGPAPC